MKPTARADKRASIENFVKQTDDTASSGEQGKVNKITKMICG